MFELIGEVSKEELLNSLEDVPISIKKEYREDYYEVYEYVNLPCSFDIEVSSFYYNNAKMSCMYCWQFGINGKVVLGRTWDEFKGFMGEVASKLKLSSKRRLPIYVHNLSYEFQFIKDRFEWIDLFAREKRVPMKATTKDGFEFRCSYMLSGCSLEQTCKDLTKYKMAKKVGDLDYELMHFPNTPLTVKEREYAIYDVLGVMAFIQEEIETYGSVVNIPMTKTGKVRLYCRNKCFSEENKKKYQITMSNLTLSGAEEYYMLKRAFQAGFTHANYLHSNEVLENVYSMDFTSSYPSVMVCEKMPMSKGEWIKVKSVEQIRNMSIDYYLIFNVQFENLREKELVPDHYISYAHCQGCKNVVTDNGRIISADRIQLTITSDDLEIIEKCYDMDNCTITIGKCIRYKLGYLPKVFIECVLDFYKDKTTLKDVEGFESEYMLKKGMLNSCFGMSVTDIVCEEIGYDDEWIANDSDTEEAIRKYNESKSRFLFYPWGIAICSRARKNLWTGIVELGQDYIYSDTDSVKFINYDKHAEYFERYNKEVCEKMEHSCRVNKLNIEYTRPKTVKGKEKPLGVWDNDGVYTRFKTLGAKRYLVEYFDEKENKLKIKSTIAGANKAKASAYIASQKDPFEFFTDKMTIDKEHSGRLIHTYIDTPMSFEVVDYLGNRYVGTELSGIHIEKSEYNLKLSPFYVHLVNSRVMQCV